MNLSLNFLPAKVRAVVYGVAVVLGLVVAAAQGGFKAIGQADPTWLAFASGALVPVSIAAGAVALANVTRKRDDSEPEVETTDDEDEEAHIDALTGEGGPEKASEFAEGQPERTA